LIAAIITTPFNTATPKSAIKLTADCGLRIADLLVPRTLPFLWRLLQEIVHRLSSAIRNPQSAIDPFGS